MQPLDIGGLAIDTTTKVSPTVERMLQDKLSKYMFLGAVGASGSSSASAASSASTKPWNEELDLGMPAAYLPYQPLGDRDRDRDYGKGTDYSYSQPSALSSSGAMLQQVLQERAHAGAGSAIGAASSLNPYQKEVLALQQQVLDLTLENTRLLRENAELKRRQNTSK